MFLQNCQNHKTIIKQIEKQGFYLPKTPTSGIIFPSFFWTFSEPSPGSTFSWLLSNFEPKMTILDPLGRPAWPQNRPLGRHFRSKNRLLSYPADGTERPRTVTEPTLRPMTPQTLPRLHFYRFCLHFCPSRLDFSPIWDGFFMIFDDFRHDFLNSCAQI